MVIYFTYSNKRRNLIHHDIVEDIIFLLRFKYGAKVYSHHFRNKSDRELEIYGKHGDIIAKVNNRIIIIEVKTIGA